MADQSKMMTRKLLDLMEVTGYPIEQHNGQRKYGPPPTWNGPPPPKGSEVFIGKLPREIFEDELVPIFSKVGIIYDLRLMMDFSGSNRGYAFVTYSTRAEATRAIQVLNGYEIRPGRSIGVVRSVDNCRLFVGGIPKTKQKEEILQELTKHVAGIVDVILYKNCYVKERNRGFAFVEFTSHRAAAMARRALVPSCVKLWGQDVMVDWAEPEPDVDDEQMRKVKVLYVRNFQISTSPEAIQAIFESAINDKIERIKKIYDYAFIHFFDRKHAELAMLTLQNIDIDGSHIEIRWAKPVNRDVYRIQKLQRGNAKFNNSVNLTQTFLLCKQHRQQDYIMNSVKDEGIGSIQASGSTCGSPSDRQEVSRSSSYTPPKDNYYMLAPAKLESMCRRYNWPAPIYDYQKYVDPTGAEVWVAQVDLPVVGAPLVCQPRRIGPLATRACHSIHQAQVEAAENALYSIRCLQADMQRTQTQLSSMYSGAMPPLPTCVTGYQYMNTPLYSRPSTIPITMPSSCIY